MLHLNAREIRGVGQFIQWDIETLHGDARLCEETGDGILDRVFVPGY